MIKSNFDPLNTFASGCTPSGLGVLSLSNQTDTLPATRRKNCRGPIIVRVGAKVRVRVRVRVRIRIRVRVRVRVWIGSVVAREPNRYFASNQTEKLPWSYHG